MCAWRVRFWKTFGCSGADILCAGMHEAGKQCTELLEKTANALNDNVVSVMLLAVQKGNLELSIIIAVTKSVFSYRVARKKPQFYFSACTMFRGREEESLRGKIIGKCLMAFPYTWIYVSAAPCWSCPLPADLCLALSLLARVWVQPPVCPVSKSCSHLISLTLSLLARMWVLPSFVLFADC